MTASPPLSVLLPVRNGGGVVGGALQSLSRQTFSDFEVIVVDDGSTDGTRDVLLSKAREDERIRVFTREPAGIVPALEFARSKAKGLYLARMDADDGAFSERFQRQMELMTSDRRIALCGTGIVYFPREQLREGALRYEKWINGIATNDDLMRGLFVECPVPHPTFLLRSDVLELVGGYRDAGWPEDYDLILRLWEGGARLGKVPEVLLRWREGTERLSRTRPTYSPEAFRRCKVHFLLRTHLRRGRGVVVWGAGPVGKAFARELKVQGGRLLAFVDLDPRKIGQEIHGAPVLDPAGFANLLYEADPYVLAAVGSPGARDEIRATLDAIGRREVHDYRVCA